MKEWLGNDDDANNNEEKEGKSQSQNQNPTGPQQPLKKQKMELHPMILLYSMKTIFVPSF